MIASYMTKAGRRWRVAIRSSKYENHFRSGFVRERDAKDYETVKLSEMIRHTFVPNEKRNLGTLGDALRDYQSEIPDDEPFKAVKINRINRWLKNPLAKRAIASLTKKDFRDWRNERRKELKEDGSRRISDRSLYKELVVIIGLWTHAMIEWHWALDECPAKLTEKSKVRRKLDKVKPEKPRIEPAEEKAISEIFARKGHNLFLEPIFSFAIETSIRAFELVQLHWSHVHEQAGVIYIPARISKNGEERWVALSDRALEILRRTPREHSEPRIFPISRSALSSAWARAKKDENFPKGVTFHSTRHEALTRLAELRLSVNQLMEMSGHKTLAMLMVYLKKGNAEETRKKIVEAREKLRESSSVSIGGVA